MVNPILPVSLTDVEVSRNGQRLLGPLDLELTGTGTTLVIGPNGAGKTTLLRVIHGLDRPGRGNIRWARPKRETHAQQAFVFQSPVMLRRRVRGNLAYPLRLHGASKAEARAGAEDWLDRLGLTSKASLRASQLSLGEKQKLALARALIRAPQIVFLDEPTASLDGAATRAIEGLITEAVRAGTRVVMSSHNLAQVRRLATEVIFLHHGRVVEAGPVPDILDTPQTADLKAFLAGDLLD